MELNISVFFSKLSLSSSQEIKNPIIELISDNKVETLPYPQHKPLFMKLSQKSDRQIISINIKPKQSTKKSKIMAHGEIIIFKKLLIEKPQEKYIILSAKENDRVRPTKDNMGKIFVKIKIEESINIQNDNKEKKTQKLEDTNEKENRNIINFDDNILDIKSTPIDKKEIEIYNIENIISFDQINKLKDIIDKGDNSNLYIKDINSIKSFNENLFKQYKELNESYFSILSNISKHNNEIKQKANKYQNDFIQSENDLYKLRLEAKQIKEEINQKIKENNDKKSNFAKNSEDIKRREINLFEEKNEEDDSNEQNIGDENNIKNICNLIKKLNSLGYRIDNGDITDSERQNLEDLLKNGENILTEKKEDTNSNTNELNRNNYELGNIIVSLIERDVNDLYMRKLIEQITIDQVDAITYSFSGDNKKYEVGFKIENNNNLICSTGETFTVWLIKNFSL